METLILHAPEVGEMTPEQAQAGSVFLAGTIDMGTGELWQPRAIQKLSGKVGAVYNPRRADWDSSWKQSITDPNFSQQVNWEIEHIECASEENRAHVVYFYFDPESQSPVTMLELGLICGMGEKAKGVPRAVVCCPAGFWRRGNIEIACARHAIPLYENFEESLDAVLTVLRLMRE